MSVILTGDTKVDMSVILTGDTRVDISVILTGDTKVDMSVILTGDTRSMSMVALYRAVLDNIRQLHTHPHFHRDTPTCSTTHNMLIFVHIHNSDMLSDLS